MLVRIANHGYVLSQFTFVQCMYAYRESLAVTGKAKC